MEKTTWQSTVTEMEKNLINVPFYNIFYSSVLKRVLSVVEHHGGGEKTTGKNSACVCVCVCVRACVRMHTHKD